MIDLQRELVSDVTIMPNPLQAPLQTLELENFLPYRLSVLAQLVSESLHDLYAGPFGLAVTEWRVMAALGRFAPLTASEVGQRIVMDKVAVSRAVARLLDSGRIARDFDDDDRRRSVLRLSEAGYAIYDQIAPLALGFERQMLDGMVEEERALLFRLIDRLDEMELRAEHAKDSDATPG